MARKQRHNLKLGGSRVGKDVATGRVGIGRCMAGIPAFPLLTFLEDSQADNPGRSAVMAPPAARAGRPGSPWEVFSFWPSASRNRQAVLATCLLPACRWYPAHRGHGSADLR